MATRNKTASITQSGNVTTVTFVNGHKVELDVSKLSKEIQHQLMLHGAKQKLGDAYASAKGDLNFAIAQCEGVRDTLLAGEFTRRASGGGGATILAEAVAKVKGVAIEDVRAKLAKLDEDSLAKLKKAPQVQQAILEIQLERKKAAAKAAPKAKGEDPLDLL